MKNDSSARIAELDGLRAATIFLISWYHIWQQSWLTPHIGGCSLDFLVRSGYVWVDGMVLLSAFLLFLPYARAMRDGGPVPDTASFYYRRVRRILPSFYFIILLVFFSVALPFRLYSSPQYAVKDLATHFTFTFTFFYDTYVATPLGAASWTLAIEVQAYLLFPLIAKCVMKKPAVTLGVICAVCFGFRGWCLWALNDYTMVVNQLLNFLDVYALGILLAVIYIRLDQPESARRRRIMKTAAATVLFAVACVLLVRLLRLYASSADYPQIQRRQMIWRPAFALCYGTLIVSCHFAAKPLRLLLGNPVMRFLSGISMNYYLIHQTVIVHMRRIGFPYSEFDLPNREPDRPWQNRYTLLSFAISLAAAVLITYLIEKPAARLFDRIRNKKREAL